MEAEALEVVKIVWQRDLGFTADFENAR